jgi:hypothetical protein
MSILGGPNDVFNKAIFSKTNYTVRLTLDTQNFETVERQKEIHLNVKNEAYNK